MQSSLKKSLYLGLAALSFASVASVTANSSNANAAKKHAAAKKVTYTTDSKKLDQSVVFKATGKNAVYNKAVGKRSVVKNGSLSDMKTKSNSKSTNDLFMAYQEGHTSKGVHYYKVVSFDKKVRGFVYNKGIAKTDNAQDVAQPSNTTGYLTQTDRFFNQAYGVQFHNNNLKKEYNGMNIAADQFTVSKAVKVNNDQTYYYVTDKNNSLINGWVNSVYFSNTVTPAAQKALDSANAVHVKFVDADNLGSVVSTANIQPNNGAYRGKDTSYTSGDVFKAASDALIGSGYHLTYANYDNVKQGSNVTILVQKNTEKDASKVKFNFKALNSNDGLPTVNDSVNLNADAPALNEAQRNSLTGHNNDLVNLNDIFNNYFTTNGAVWNTIKDGGNTYVFDKDTTMAANKQLLSNNKLRMSAANVTVYYKLVQPNSSQVSQNTTQQNDSAATKGFFDNTTQTIQPKNDNLNINNNILSSVAKKVNKQDNVKNAFIKINNDNVEIHYVKTQSAYDSDKGKKPASADGHYVDTIDKDITSSMFGSLSKSDADSLKSSMNSNGITQINFDNNSVKSDNNKNITFN